MTIVNTELLIQKLKELDNMMDIRIMEARLDRANTKTGTFDRGYVIGEEYTFKEIRSYLSDILSDFTGE